MESDAYSIERNFREFLCLKKLGSGSFASVYKVRDKRTNIESAIKKVHHHLLRYLYLEWANIKKTELSTKLGF